MKYLLLLLMGLASLLSYGQVPTTNLTGEYRFTNGSLMNTAGDEALTQNGTAMILTPNRAGGAGRAVSLNGDYLQRVGTSGYDITVSFWIKTSTNDANKTVIVDQTERASEAEGASETGWYTFLQNGVVNVAGNFQWYHSNNTAAGATGYTGYHYTSATTNVSDDGWHHVAISIDAYAGNWFNEQYQRTDRIIQNSYKIYIDGILEGSHVETKNVGSATHPAMRRFINAAEPLTVGNSKAGNSINVYQQAIDDIRYYNAVLGSTDIAALTNETGCVGSSGVTVVTQDLTVQLDSEGQATITAEAVDNGSTDSCGDPVSSVSLDNATFTCSELGANTVTLTALDSDGNSATGTATITVEPLITVVTHSETIVLDVDDSGHLILTPEDVDAGTSSPCNGLTLSLDRTDFSCSDVGTNVAVTLTATDEVGNSASATATVRAEDTSAPIALAQDVSVELDPTTGTASVTTDMIDNGSSDNCAANMSLSKTQFSCADLGENTVTLTVTDNRGNVTTAQATVTVTSIVKEEIVTADQTAFCTDGSTGATLSIASSVVGVDYYLRNSADQSNVAGPLAGTGGALDFNTGNLFETTTFHVFGVPQQTASTGYALDFDGVDDYVDMGTDARGITTALSVAAWVKTSFSGASNFISGKYDFSQGYVLYIDANGQVKIDGRDASGAYKSSGPSTTVVNDDAWHYIVGTIDVTTGVWNIYIDGVLENSASNGTGTTLNASTSVHGLGSFGTNFFTGQIDRFALWDVALDETNVEAYGSECFSGEESGLVAYFEVNENSGTVLADLASLQLDATMYNMDATTDWVNGQSGSCHSTCGVRMATEITIGDSEAPVVSVHNISVAQDLTGVATITTSDINNGSNDNCSAVENLTLTLDKTSFTCDEMGDQVVTLTVVDESGNSASATATVTITSSIVDQVLSAPATNICPGESTTISTEGSQLDINYYLKNEAGDLIEGPIEGTGESLTFSTGEVATSTTYHVYAEPAGASDQAMKLAGTSGFVSIPSSPSLQLDANWTIEAWVKSNGSEMNIVETYDGNGGYILRTSGYTLQAYAMFSSSSYLALSSTTQLVVGEWTHVAATFNETTDEFKLYINGVLNATNASATIDQRGGTATIKLGARGDDSRIQSEHLQDEVRIWNIERTAQEITDHHAEVLQGDETGLVAYYNYNSLTFAATGMVISDRSPNGNDGVMQGSYTEDNLVDGALLENGGACGIQMSTSLTISTEDTEAPIAMAQNIALKLDENDHATITAEEVDNGSSDNCSTVTLSLDITDFDASNIGENTVTLTVTDVAGNSSTATAIVTVEPFKLNQSITLNGPADMTFGAANPSISASASSDLPVSFTVSGPASLDENVLIINGAGQVTVTASQSGNENYLAAETVEHTFSVHKANLAVKADDQQMIFGNEVPTLTFSYSGFVGEDGENVLDEIPTVSTVATSSSDVGTYEIVLSGGAAANYSLSLEGAILTIDQATATILFSDLEHTADGNAKVPVVTTMPAGLQVDLTYDGSVEPPVAVGTYLVIATINEHNWNGTQEATLVISEVLAAEEVLSSNISVYPNPAADQLMVSNPEGKGKYALLYNLEGHEVAHFELTSLISTQDLTNVSNGMYILILTDENHQQMDRKKIVVRH